MVMSITIALTMTSQSEQSPQQHALAVGIAAQGEEARLRTAQRFKCWLTGGLVNQSKSVEFDFIRIIPGIG